MIAMDERINRFKLCDLHFYPFLSGVIERLPEEVQQEVLDDKSFQILTDDDALNACVLRYRFSDPVETLVYLNTKILKESRRLITYTIASEIAHYILNKRKADLRAKDIDALLLEWGFEKEVGAARSDLMICESKGYKAGYDWAKKQNRDYLMQHFGIYYDEWNDKGIGGLPAMESETAGHLNGTDSILEKIIRLKKGEADESYRDKFTEPPSLRKSMLAGIMAAIKELSP
jgi:hypothetical protein